MTARRRKARSGRASRQAAEITPERLIAEAEQARQRAYAPYSRFTVGAALLTRAGRVVHGCNVENASYGLCMCAERTAALKAVSEGECEFLAVAVTAGKGEVASPCGSCRQFLHEFAPRMQVYWRDARGRIVKRRLDALLKDAFDLEKAKRR